MLTRQSSIGSGDFELGDVRPQKYNLQNNGVTGVGFPRVDFNTQVSRVNTGSRNVRTGELIILNENCCFLLVDPL